MLRRADGSVDVVVADVAGKGFAASLIMASVKAMLPFVTAVRQRGFDVFARSDHYLDMEESVESSDALISLARQVCDDPPTRELDMLLTTGEGRAHQHARVAGWLRSRGGALSSRMRHPG